MFNKKQFLVLFLDLLELAPPKINILQLGIALTEHPECPHLGSPILMSGFDHTNFKPVSYPFFKLFNSNICKSLNCLPAFHPPK